ncbi:MAG: CHRD domain-containing protein [Rhodospirillales bacterium]|nr:CHRD domain-containing protein [Rhodospirillales bacterium]
MTLLRGITLAIGLMLVGASAADAASVPFAASLRGDQEVPPVATSALGTASALLTGDFGANNFVLQYAVAYSGLSTPIAPVAGTGGHLHNAPVGVNGAIVHLFDTSPFNYTGTQS